MSRQKYITPQERLFCRAYVNNGFNGKAAAELAGYEGGASTAVYLTRKPQVATHIGELIERKAQLACVDKDYIAEALIEIRELDFADIVDENGNVKTIREWPKAWRRSISGLDFGSLQELADPKTGQRRRQQLIKKIKLPDKLKAIELLGKHIDVGAWEKDTAVSVNVQNIMPVPVADSVESWEQAAAAQQEKVLSHAH
mgnify:CR=1 FL=1